MSIISYHYVTFVVRLLQIGHRCIPIVTCTAAAGSQDHVTHYTQSILPRHSAVETVIEDADVCDAEVQRAGHVIIRSVAEIISKSRYNVRCITIGH